MMFSKLAFGLSTLTILAAATPTPGGEPASSCSTGALQCCSTVGSSTDPTIANELAAIGVILQGVDILVGLTCSAISVIGVGTGNDCSANAVCCQDNNVGGLASIGCVPVTL